MRPLQRNLFDEPKKKVRKLECVDCKEFGHEYYRPQFFSATIEKMCDSCITREKIMKYYYDDAHTICVNCIIFGRHRYNVLIELARPGERCYCCRRIAVLPQIVNDAYIAYTTIANKKTYFSIECSAYDYHLICGPCILSHTEVSPYVRIGKIGHLVECSLCGRLPPVEVPSLQEIAASQFTYCQLPESIEYCLSGIKEIYYET